MQIVHLRCSKKCGLIRKLHDDALQEANEWNVKSHTKTEPTDAFGELQFEGSTVKTIKVGANVLSVLTLQAYNYTIF